MPDKDINIHLKTQGTAQTKQDLDGTSRSIRKSGEAAEETKSKFGKLGGDVTSWAKGLVSITASIGAFTRAALSDMRNMEQAASSAAQAVKHQRDLMSLGDFAKRHPKLDVEMGQIALAAGLPGVEGRIEAQQAYELIESSRGQMTDAQLVGIMNQSAKLRQTTKAEMNIIAPLLQAMLKADKSATPAQLANLFQQTKTEAGSTTPELSSVLPELFPLGVTGGVLPEEISAMYSIASRDFGANKAMTGVRNMMMILRGGELKPEAQDILNKRGISSDMSMTEQLSRLQGASLPELKTIFEREVAGIAASITGQLPAYQESLGRISNAYRNPAMDLVGDAIKEIYKPGSKQYQQRQLDILEAQIEQFKYEFDAPRGLDLQIQQRKEYLKYRSEGYPHWMAAGAAGLNKGVRAGYGMLEGAVDTIGYSNPDNFSNSPWGPINHTVYNNPIIYTDGTDHNHQPPELHR